MLLASNHWLNMQTGTRPNALLLMRVSPPLLNNADHSDSLLLSSETERLSLCPQKSLNSIPMPSSQPFLLFHNAIVLDTRLSRLTPIANESPKSIVNTSQFRMTSTATLRASV